MKRGESFECVFKLEIGNMPYELIGGDKLSLMMGETHRSNVLDSSLVKAKSIH